MAFLLRTVSHSAEGREIVRTARVEGEKLSIGRDPASDVHLTDLAVALRHATIERVTPSRLELRAGEGLSVELNGRKVAGGHIDLGTGGDIRIGSHILRFMPGAAGAADVDVAVERVTEGEAQLERIDERRFSLASVMPGKRPLAWALAILVLGIFLAWPVWTFYDRQGRTEAVAGFHADRLWLSGSLSQVHSSLKNDCTACHAQPFVAVRDESCTSCHNVIHDHADQSRLARARPELGTWGRVQLAFQETFGLTPGRCVDCHTEHEGPQEMAPTPQRFCADCHGGLADRLPDTKLGDAGDFGRSHPEFQPSVLIRWDNEVPVMQRVPLGRNPQEASNLRFPHALHLSPSGGVAQMGRRLSSEHGFGQSLACADCHVPTPDGTRFQPVDMEGDCAMCHDLAFDRVGGTVRTLRHGSPEQVVADLREFYRGRVPARPSVLLPNGRRRPGDVAAIRSTIQYARALQGSGSQAERAIRGVFSQGGACFDCHQVQAPPSGSLAFRIRPVAFPTRYMHHGWFDHRPHQQTQCSTCHAAEGSQSANDLLLPDLQSCRTCHGGESSGADVPSTCAMCHDYHMDEGVPAMLLRQRVRGRRWETTVIPVQPRPAAGTGRGPGR
ncbi:cytochrome c3 family protein [Allosphingosinicella sp.]|uniref:cytochrome c3 family protein n=1 Tax=Allosphingosinicella sp. TaxID=2823234 RepID=UPI002EF7E34D